MYTYQKNSNPSISSDFAILLNDPNLFDGTVEEGQQLANESFFDVLDTNKNVVGYVWFEHYSEDREIEVSFTKLENVSANGFTNHILSNLTNLQEMLPNTWFDKKSKWLLIVKPSNPNKNLLTYVFKKNNFNSTEKEDNVFLKPVFEYSPPISIKL